MGNTGDLALEQTDTGSNTSFEAAFYGCLSNNGSSIGDGAKNLDRLGFTSRSLNLPYILHSY